MNRRSHAPDSAQQHRDWLSLVEVSGPFLSLPVLRATWPTLDTLDKPMRDKLRLEHATWQADTAAGQRGWLDFVLGGLLGWGDALVWNDGGELDALALDVSEHDTRITPSFALVEPGEDAKPTTSWALGLVCEPGTHPTSRIAGEPWAASPVDRLARLCRQHEVQLGLATDGRWWVLVSAPRGKVTTTAIFDAVAWNETAERDVVRAFQSLLCRRRFFGVPDEERLVTLLRKSEDSQEDITEALGVQVRQAVELLVAAIGRADTAQRERGEPGVADVDAHEVYRGAVSVMMRIVFLLFAEERKLLPSDNELYATSYSAGRLCATLEQEALEGSEDDLEHSHRRWHRLLALFQAVYRGIDHPRLRMHAHDGSLFDPDAFGWLPRNIDDRTVLHMLHSVQYVEIGTGRSKERRKLSFRELDVEQIGYVYEGLLSYDGFRADEVVVSLIGKRGYEKEVGLRELESLAAHSPDVPALAKAIADEYKDHKVGSPRAVEKALAPLTGADKENARRQLLAVTRGDAALTERLMPFSGIIRLDLREQPVVIMPGELFVTDSPLRKNTGTHYTPAFLAEQIVEGALQPLVYEPGPLQTADEDAWRRKSSKEILALKVADIAMGSAAFLVAAARYLGEHLIAAWTREGDERVRGHRVSEAARDADEDPVVIEARRQIIEHCLYGVDINPMAVEMAKLSLWLVSMDPHRPFTFLDDRLVAGDSLLGITSLEQLEYMHMDPKKGRAIHERGLVDFTAGVRELVADVAEERKKLADIDGTTLEGLARKRTVLAEAELKTSRARLFADLCVGAALANAKRGDNGLRDGSIAAADYARRIDTGEMQARQKAKDWLETDRPDGGFRREPLHWPLVFPEVFEHEGFDAVIGNPPFFGGPKISPALGEAYRKHLTDSIARNGNGRADLVAYFFIIAHRLLHKAGQSGLMATDTLAQGDTMETGLERVVMEGSDIRRAIKSERWPTKSAAPRYCVVWCTRLPIPKTMDRTIDDLRVASISPALEPAITANYTRNTLSSNKRIAFIGHDIKGAGFILSSRQAADLLARDPRTKDVVHPYIKGSELNHSPKVAADSYIINFQNWPLEQCRPYTSAFKIVEDRVRPERMLKNRKSHRVNWWRYADYRRGLEEAVRDLDTVVAMTLHSKHLIPTIAPGKTIYSHGCVVFATNSRAMLAILTSSVHYLWATTGGASSLSTTPRYAPSDKFETFPLPTFTEELGQLGDRLHMVRRDMMVSRDIGLTDAYNLVFNRNCTDGDIEELRRIHREIDEATIRAYGWEGRIEAVGGLDHGFHQVGRETRYTIGPDAQGEILNSLLELNHERYAEEVAQGLHDKKGGRKPKPADGTLF